MKSDMETASSNKKQNKTGTIYDDRGANAVIEALKINSTLTKLGLTSGQQKGKAKREYDATRNDLKDK